MNKLLLFIILILNTQVFAQSSAPKSVVFKKDSQSVSTGFLIDINQPTYKISPEFMPVTAPSKRSTGCDENVTNFGNSFQKGMDNFQPAIAKLHCEIAENVKLTKKLDTDTCQELALCMRGKLDLSKASTVYMIEKAREKTAMESIALISQATVNQMIKDAELKAYALEKYGASEIPEECNATEVIDKSCKTSIIDEGYEVAQRLCRIPEEGCQPGYLDFAYNKKTEEGKTSVLGQFIKEQGSSRAKKYLSDDSAITQKIASLMVGKKLTNEDKFKNVFAFMEKNYHLLSPVFKSYYDESKNSQLKKEKDATKEEFLKFIATAETKSSQEVAKALESINKDEAQRRLKNSCHSGMKMNKLCGLVSDVIKGAEVIVPIQKFEKMLSRKDFMANDLRMNNDELILAVSRCNTFTLNHGALSANKVLTKLSKGKNFFSLIDGGLFSTQPVGASYDGLTNEFEGTVRMSIILNTEGEVSKKDSFFASKIEKINTNYGEYYSRPALVEKSAIRPTALNVNNANPKPEEPAKVLSGSIITSEKKEVSENRPSESSPSTQPKIQQNFLPIPQESLRENHNFRGVEKEVTNNDYSISNENSLKTDRTDKSVKDEKDYEQLMKKVSGLEEKLALAQKKKIESETKAEPVNSEESELIKELKNAKNTLNDLSKARSNGEEVFPSNKSLEDVKQSDVTTLPESSEGVASTSSLSSPQSRQQASVTAPQVRSNEVSERGPASIEDSKPINKSSSGSEEAREVNINDKGEGIFLTKLDGIAPAKANEAITNMIIAESGRPFYIEEGGLVKQIIPEIVDGKVLKDQDGHPIYKTVVKGKIGEFKINTKNQMSLSSPADIKRQEDKKSSPAIRYRDLQQIFSSKK